MSLTGKIADVTIYFFIKVFMSISIVIVDDHPVIGHGLKSILGKQANFSVVGDAKDGKGALRVISEEKPDVIILDIILDGIDGISLISKINEISPTSKVIMYTMHDSNDYVVRSFQAGALGYILKSDRMAELVIAINSVTSNQLYFSTALSPTVLQKVISGKNKQQDLVSSLTPREYEIGALMAQGAELNQIATSLFISPKTVRVHRTNIMHKLSCKNVHQLLLQLHHYFPQ